MKIYKCIYCGHPVRPRLFYEVGLKKHVRQKHGILLLNEVEHRIFLMLSRNEWLPISYIAKRTGLSYQKVDYILTRFAAYGILQVYRPVGRVVYYKVKPNRRFFIEVLDERWRVK